MKKIIGIIFIVICLLFTFFAVNSNAKDLSWDNIQSKANGWVNSGKTMITEDQIADAVLPVGQMLTAIGVAVLFGGIVILGIKYMISEPEAKGKLKQQLIGLVVAGVVIFGAYTIWNLVYNFFNGLFK